MKVLVVGRNNTASAHHEIVNSSLGETSIFGYDALVVDPHDFQLMTNGHSYPMLCERWSNDLSKWLTGNHRIIVIIRPKLIQNGISNYSWLPLKKFVPGNIIPCGSSNFIGSVVAPEGSVKKSIKNNTEKFTVVCHYKHDGTNDSIIPNSRVEESLLTAFSYKYRENDIVFLPVFDIFTPIDELLSMWDSAQNKWKIPEYDELQVKLNDLDGKIETLENDRKNLVDEITALNSKISNIISGDLYLERAINSFNLTQGTENPDPENFYEAIEAIEKAFSSEREMRETLGLSKNFIDKITRRTNEFRHVAKSGEKAEPLTNDEISDFTNKTTEVIAKYIDFIYRDQNAQGLHDKGKS